MCTQFYSLFLLVVLSICWSNLTDAYVDEPYDLYSESNINDPWPSTSSLYPDNNYLSLLETDTNWDKNGQIEIDIPVLNDASFAPNKPNNFYQSQLVRKLLPTRYEFDIDEKPTGLDEFNSDEFDGLIDKDTASYYPIGIQPIVIKFTEISKLEPVGKEQNNKEETTKMKPGTKSTPFNLTTNRINSTSEHSNSSNTTDSNHHLKAGNSSTKSTRKFDKDDLFSSSGTSLLNNLHRNLKEFRSKVNSKYDSFDHLNGLGKASSERLIQKRVHGKDQLNGR